MLGFLISFSLIFLICLIILVIISLIIWSERKTLIRGGISWSAKELPLRRGKTKEDSSLLKEIDLESSKYLNELEEENR